MIPIRAVSLVAVLAGLCSFQTHSLAAISGINSPVTSMASIQFDDTTSLNPFSLPGTTNIMPTVSSWAGATFSLPSTTDLVTFDNAQGDISASFAGNTYAITFANVTLTQAVLNTGFAHLIFTFDVEYQLDGAGLPSQLTISPIFAVSGTVQPAGFASVGGFINYDAVNTAGTISTVETVNYSGFWNTPGPFSATVIGVPNSGNTPLLVANTTLRLWGSINFMVDPASINAFSYIPEPSMMTLLAVPAALSLRRRFRQA